jgi:hypothetical protein
MLAREYMLDTETGSPAELVYPRLGYTRVSRQNAFPRLPSHDGFSAQI